MKFLPLLWAGLWRKRARAIFSLLSIVIAFLLVGIMSGVNAHFSQLVDEARLDRILVGDRFGGFLPVASIGQIEQLPGVREVVGFSGMGGFYQNPRNRTGVVLTDERWLDVYPEAPITREQFALLKGTRTGIIIDRELAIRFGLKAGDRFPLQTIVPQRDGTTAWVFDVVAVVPSAGTAFPAATANFSYVDEGRVDDRAGTVNGIALVVDDPAKVNEIANNIETMFASSSTPVNATPEHLFIANALQSFININFLTYAVSAAALFMILFLTSNVMAQSVHERIPEFAVMKTLGMGDRLIFTLVLLEALLPYVTGAALGLGLSAVAAMLARETAQGLGALAPVITPGVVMSTLAIAIVAAVLGGLPAAWRVKRLQIAEALVVR